MITTIDDIEKVLDDCLPGSCKKCNSTKVDVIVKLPDFYEFDLQTRKLIELFTIDQAEPLLDVICQKCHTSIKLE